jgi:hypothetical protein
MERSGMKNFLNLGSAVKNEIFQRLQDDNMVCAAQRIEI